MFDQDGNLVNGDKSVMKLRDMDHMTEDVVSFMEQNGWVDISE
jgi:hypothetical protein